MDYRRVWDSLCVQLSHQAGKDVDLLWEPDIEVQGAIVWLEGNQLPEGTGADGLRRKQNMQELFVVNEVVDDTVMLAPVFQKDDVAGGTRFLRRADAVQLHLAQTKDFLGDRSSEMTFIWLVSRLRKIELSWEPRGFKSQRAHDTKTSHMESEAASVDESSRVQRKGIPKCQSHEEARRGSGRHHSKQDGAYDATSQGIHRSGRTLLKNNCAEDARPVAPPPDMPGNKHLKRMHNTTQGMAGAAPPMKPVPHNFPRCKPASLPKQPSKSAKKVPSAKIRRIKADKKRMRDQLDPAKVHERKEKQKQSFLNLPQANTDAVDLPNMRHTSKQ